MCGLEGLTPAEGNHGDMEVRGWAIQGRTVRLETRAGEFTAVASLRLPIKGAVGVGKPTARS